MRRLRLHDDADISVLVVAIVIRDGFRGVGRRHVHDGADGAEEYVQGAEFGGVGDDGYRHFDRGVVVVVVVVVVVRVGAGNSNSGVGGESGVLRSKG